MVKEKIKIKCPYCQKSMILRKGKYGEFYGCNYPVCKNTLTKSKAKAVWKEQQKKKKVAKGISIKWTQEQVDIFKWVEVVVKQQLKGSLEKIKALQCKACAGSGKTTVIERGIKVGQEVNPNLSTIYLVFGKLNQEIALSRGLPAITTHTFGRRAIANYCRANGLPAPIINKNKLYEIIKDKLGDAYDRKLWMIGPTKKVVDLLKSKNMTPSELVIQNIIDNHDIEVKLPKGYNIGFLYDFIEATYYTSIATEEYRENKFQVILKGDTSYTILSETGEKVSLATRARVSSNFANPSEKVAYILHKHKLDLEPHRKISTGEIIPNITEIDFADMLQIPLYWAMEFDTYDLVACDEVQDFTKSQIKMTEKALGSNSILLCVGDSDQSCYHFRGAMLNAMEHIQKKFNADLLGLSYTFRSPKTMVKWINDRFPQIPYHCLPIAKEGSISTMSERHFLSKVKAGDGVICRLNSPLVEYALSLIKRDIKVSIRGKQFSDELRLLIKYCSKGVTNIGGMLRRLETYKKMKVGKYRVQQRKEAISKIYDKVKCIVVLTEYSSNLSEVESNLERVFKHKDSKEVINFMTIHMSKGLEFNKVYSLVNEEDTEASDIQLQQEENLQYILHTRNKEDFIEVNLAKN